MKKVKAYLKKFWRFLQGDSWASFVVTLLIAFVVIKYIFFPGLSFLTGTSLPLVIVESCSMYHHEDGFERIFSESDVYEDEGITLDDTSNWIFPDGFSKGDVIFVVGADEIEVGDVIIFEGNARHPLIHRVVYANDTFATKGDNYKTNSEQLGSEKSIYEEQIIGKALFRVPLVGWAKLIFFEWSRPQYEQGMCK